MLNIPAGLAIEVILISASEFVYHHTFRKGISHRSETPTETDSVMMCWRESASHHLTDKRRKQRGLNTWNQNPSCTSFVESICWPFTSVTRALFWSLLPMALIGLSHGTQCNERNLQLPPVSPGNFCLVIPTSVVFLVLICSFLFLLGGCCASGFSENIMEWPELPSSPLIYSAQLQKQAYNQCNWRSELMRTSVPMQSPEQHWASDSR